jgi:hypothetical protein
MARREGPQHLSLQTEDHVPRLPRSAKSFVRANDDYENWLKRQCDVVCDDLKRKHRRMRRDPFVFLRATYFRWAQRIEGLCSDLASAPSVLAVGDLHVENFGTWRDDEGRLVWGVNDFDEASVMPFAFDLVRLATSVRLAPGLPFPPRRASEAILFGYRRGLQKRAPTLLDERETWMRGLVACTECDRERFWRDIDENRPLHPPEDAIEALRSALPDGALIDHYAGRSKGGGSLGRPRYIVVADWQGGRIVREAKALVASAWDWAHGDKGHPRRPLALAYGPFRAPDPFLRLFKDKFIVRKLAADSRKVEFGADGAAHLEERLLAAMGADLVAIHGARAADAKRIEEDLDDRPPDWLHESAKRAACAVVDDYKEYTAEKGGSEEDCREE